MLRLQRIENGLLFLTLLLLPTQLGKHFWPQFSFVYSLPIDYLSPTLYFWDILVVILNIIILLRNRYINKLALNLLFFFILSQLMSLLLNNTSLQVGLVRLEQYLIAGLFGVYIASTSEPVKESVIFWGLTASIIGESFLAIAQFLKGATVGFWLLGERTFSLSTAGIAKFDFYGREFLRPYATFPHPNVLAAFMLVVVIIINSKKNPWKKIILGSTILACLSVFLTMSRAAIAAGLILTAIVFFKSSKRLIILIAVMVLLPVLYTRFSSLLNFDNLTFIRREELSVIALKMWSSSPVLGVGLNNFIPYGSDLLLAGPSRFLQPVHNIFLLTLSETGIVGLTGLIILIGYPIILFFKLKSKFFINPILLVWGVIIFLGMFDHYFLTLPQGYRLLFLAWGLTVRMLR